MNKIITIIIIFLIGAFIGYLGVSAFSLEFSDLSPEEMHEQIIEQRDFAIKEAVKAGDYKCCINPACTMCYMEANKWNNFTAGTCACDDLIAKGEEPCPQCVRDLNSSCEISNELCE